MSKLIKCHSCQSEIASDSKACPKCGSPNKKGGCLKVVFGGFLVVVSVMFLIAAGSTEKGEAESKSETNKEADAAPASAKETVVKPVPKKADDIATAPKGSDNASKSASKKASEREKLKVKGLYIGMPIDQVVEAVTPSIKQLSATMELNIDGESIFNTDGALVPKAIVSCEAPGLLMAEYGRDAWLVGLTTGRSSDDTMDKFIGGHFLFVCVSRSKGGEVEYIAFPNGRIFNLNSKGKELVQLFINSYKLAIIAPMALLGKEETENDWSCKFPFGVEVEIKKTLGTIFLSKIPSESEEKAAKAKAAEDAKKGFN